MRKIIPLLLLCLLHSTIGKAQDINQVLTNMPRDIIYGLTPQMKDKLLDSPKDTTVSVSTAIYSKIERKALTPDYISLKTSEAGTTEIKLLSLINGSKIICMVQTVCGTICDSKISFYTDKWKPINSEDIFPQKSINWFIREGIDTTEEKYTNAMAAINMFPVRLSLSAEEDIVRADFDPKSFLTVEDYKTLEPYLTKESKIFRWDQSRFE